MAPQLLSLVGALFVGRFIRIFKGKKEFCFSLIVSACLIDGECHYSWVNGGKLNCNTALELIQVANKGGYSFHIVGIDEEIYFSHKPN